MSAFASTNKTFRLFIIVLLACCVAFAVSLAPAVADDAQAATTLSTSGKVSGKSYTTKTLGVNSASATDTKGYVGSRASTAKGLNYVKAKKSSSYGGSVTYTVWCGSKYYSGSNGKAVGSSKAITAVKMNLTSTMLKKYDIAYRVYLKGYGWMPWVKNNTKTGTSSTSHPVIALQAKLVSKGKSLGATYSYTDARYVGAGFFNLTKDLKTDNAIVKACKAAKCTTWKSVDSLKAGCRWIGKNVTYAATSTGDAPKGAMSAARLKVEAPRCFISKKGDCYTMSAGMYWMARYVGYTTAKGISGQRAKFPATSYAVDYTTYATDGKISIAKYGEVGKLQKTDADGNLLYLDAEGAETIEVTDTPAWVQAKDAKGEPLFVGADGKTTTTDTGIIAPAAMTKHDSILNKDYYCTADDHLVCLYENSSWATVTIDGAYRIFDPLTYGQITVSYPKYLTSNITYATANKYAKDMIAGVDAPKYETNTYKRPL